ncbi:methyl-accepting chemotaxis protein [Celeribacter sp.]|uniref:methyl-accepting chemotaxis protein n=1 Tax=Celeribacter sp. TaxID=1890673 RepID=UPI003A8D9F94
MFNKLIRLFRSVAVKLVSVLAFMALLTGIEVYQGLSSAHQSKDAVNAFRTEVVPDLERSARMVQAIGLVTEGLSQTLQASDNADMDVAMSDVIRYTEQIGRIARDLPDDERDFVLNSAAEIEGYIAEVQSAQLDAITYDSRTLKGADELSAAITAIQSALSGMIEQTMTAMRARAGEIPEATFTLNDIENKRLLLNDIGALNSVVLTGASADHAKDLAAAQTTALALLDAIRQRTQTLTLPKDLTPHFDAIWEWTADDTGILAAREVVLEAREAADEAAYEASSYISALSMRAQAHGKEILQGISDTSQITETNAEKNIQTMLIAAGLSLVAVLVALAVTFLYIIRPLLKVTRVTERLSKGDMRPVTGFETRRDEIGRMGAALAVFRDGMIERERLRDEESAREAEEQSRKTREAAATQKREQEERERAAEMERERLEQETRLLEEKAELNRIAEEERRALADEQAVVVSTLAQAMSRMADGDMAIQINDQFPPAYETLRADFNSAITSLSDMISEIATSAARIDNTSTEIALATNDLSNRTENSAVSLEHTASAIHEMTAAVASAAENAEVANSVSRETNDRAGISQTVVSEAITAMSEIEGSSREISKIIDVIDDISFQTNLLALNAGVEAARAGEAGRGFAVVASEVRALAQRSSDAAREISQLITASNGHVERGVHLVGEAGQTLKDIITSVSEIASNVNGIATSSREQSIGLQEINTATSQLESTMQQNAAMTEETTAASQMLSSEAQHLIEIVQRFHIEADTQSPHAPPLSGAA